MVQIITLPLYWLRIESKILPDAQTAWAQTNNLTYFHVVGQATEMESTAES